MANNNNNTPPTAASTCSTTNGATTTSTTTNKTTFTTITPKDEIDRQHARAVKAMNDALAAGYSCRSKLNDDDDDTDTGGDRQYDERRKRNERGEIPLWQKRRPLFEIFLDDDGNDYGDNDDYRRALDLYDETPRGDAVYNNRFWCTPPSSVDDDDDESDDDDDSAEKKTAYISGGFCVATGNATTSNSYHCWSSRGHVSVEALQALVREGYDRDYYRNDAAAAVPPSKTANGGSTSCNGKMSATVATTTTKNDKTNGSSEQRPPKKYTAADVVSRTNYWDPVNAAVNNVTIRRPSHDSLGIGKIVLIYADDFLQTVYECPWWYGDGDRDGDGDVGDDGNDSDSSERGGLFARRIVRPILENVLRIPASRVVRCMLTSLPPGMTIPTHYDTGEWVRRTHRVHVPVLVSDPDRVLFRAGTTIRRQRRQRLLSSQDERIDCRPGHVFELNTQAWHSATNGMDSDHRVHLIVDYVDGEDENGQPLSIPRVRLRPGEVLLQTRRSLDRLQDKGTRPCPTFFILGAQKAGATSLYEYVMQHPLAVRPKRRETHCLDWRWKEYDHNDDDGNGGNGDQQRRGQSLTVEEQRAWCRSFYHAEQLQYYPSCFTGDSTPSYLLDSRRVIPRLKTAFFEHCREVKFLVMLRDPVQRAESQYAMVTSTDLTPAQLKARGTEWRDLTFRQVVMQDLERMRECGLIPYWDIENGTLDEARFEQFTGTKQEDDAWDSYLSRHVPLNTGSYGLLSRGMYELNLRPWLRAFDRAQFLILTLDEMTKNHQEDGGGGDSSGGGRGGVQETMQRVWKHLGVPPFTKVVVDDEAKNNTRSYNTTAAADDELKQYLRNFFEPHNRRLKIMLLGNTTSTQNHHHNDCVFWY